VPLEVSSLDGRFEAWEYAPLFGELAYYFLTADFQDSHDFAFLGTDQREVGFCSRRRDETYIDGRALFDDSGALIAIDWFYATPNLDEGAGGRVEFDPDAEHPLPEVGVYWRRLPLGDFREWSYRYLSWSVGAA